MLSNPASLKPITVAPAVPPSAILPIYTSVPARILPATSSLIPPVTVVVPIPTPPVVDKYSTSVPLVKNLVFCVSDPPRLILFDTRVNPFSNVSGTSYCTPASNGVVVALVILPSASIANIGIPVEDPYVAATTDVSSSSVAPTTPGLICKLLYGPETSPKNTVVLVINGVVTQVSKLKFCAPAVT